MCQDTIESMLDEADLKAEQTTERYSREEIFERVKKRIKKRIKGPQ